MTDSLARMRSDWDRRADEDAEHYVYTRDSAGDVADFERSGEANYNQLVRPFLPILLEGRPAAACRVVEVGCGIGRMTRAFAAAFGEVDAVDVSPRMIERARERLRDCPNVRLHTGSGRDLAMIGDGAADLVFSYIVFQHVPSREVIENYVREAARVLRPGGAFKFQLSGDQSPEYLARERDTWLGETFSYDQALEMLRGFSLLAAEGVGTQYFVLTARKGSEPVQGLRGYILPGQAWAAAQLLEGWGDPVEESWRPVEPVSRALVAAPEGGEARFFAGVYFWPGTTPCEVAVAVDGREIGSQVVAEPGDAYLEFVAPVAENPAVVEMRLEPAPSRPPAVRCLGTFSPGGA